MSKTGKTSKVNQECIYQHLKLPDHDDISNWRFTLIGGADSRMKLRGREIFQQC